MLTNVKRSACLLPILLMACSADKTTCVGAAPTVALVEGYCKNNEANRCYYDTAPLDGF